MNITNNTELNENISTIEDTVIIDSSCCRFVPLPKGTELSIVSPDVDSSEHADVALFYGQDIVGTIPDDSYIYDLFAQGCVDKASATVALDRTSSMQRLLVTFKISYVKFIHDYLTPVIDE